MSINITSLPVANTIDPVADVIPIVTNSINTTQQINRNTLLGLSSNPVSINDTQTLTNKTITAPNISAPVLSGTVTGTYTLGGNPTFPASVATLTGSQTLTNKVLTSPTINSPTITNATFSSDVITGYTTSNSGSLYGINVTTGQITTSSSVLPAALATAIPYSKFYNPYKFNYYRNSALTLTSAAFTTLIYDTVTFDTGSNYSNSTGKFTAPVAGFYQFQAIINCQTAPATNITLSLFKNVSTEVARGVQAFAGNVNAVIVSALISLSASDTIQVQYFSSTAVAISTGIVTQFSGYLVSTT